MKEVFWVGSYLRLARLRPSGPVGSGTRHAFMVVMTAAPPPLRPPLQPPLRLALRLALLPDDRPRERLAALGPECLADAELVALLLGSGRKGENALELAASLLAALGGLPGLAQAEPEDLTRQAGIGEARAAV